MRSLIRASAALFVVLGAMVFGIALLMLVVSFLSGEPGAGIMVMLMGVAAAASVILVGGATYLLASIDERLDLLSWQARALRESLSATGKASGDAPV